MFSDQRKQIKIALENIPEFELNQDSFSLESRKRKSFETFNLSTNNSIKKLVAIIRPLYSLLLKTSSSLKHSDQASSKIDLFNLLCKIEENYSDLGVRIAKFYEQRGDLVVKIEASPKVDDYKDAIYQFDLVEFDHLVNALYEIQWSWILLSNMMEK